MPREYPGQLMDVDLARINTSSRRLFDAGLLELNASVDRLLPELAARRMLVRPDEPPSETVPAERSIAVRDLLTFT